MLRCAVVGAKGYTGVEITKILMQHPEVEISYLADVDDVAAPVQKYISNVLPNEKMVIAKYSPKDIVAGSDIIFLALPHRVSMQVAGKYFDKHTVVIDLSADYRFRRVATYEKWYGTKHTSAAWCKKAVYGLAELFTDEIKKASLIANPGCFPTGTILGLAPLLGKGLIKEDAIIIDAKTGVSGAGRKPSPANHFGELHENFKAYKVNQHQHAPEMADQLNRFAKQPVSITFVPHLLPLSRGILTTIYLERKAGVTAKQIAQAYKTYYAEKVFVRYKGEGVFPQLKDVAYTNFCDIGFTIDKKNSRLIVITAIDNLLKGAAGQAVQNMNIRCGFKEETGFFKLAFPDFKVKPNFVRSPATK